jgi:dTDP-4-amino-4,6-dideoxygalactose transaminase
MSSGIEKPIRFFQPPRLSYLEVQRLQHDFASILESGMLSYGDYCEAFEEEVRRHYHVDYAFVTPNATVALDTLVKIINPHEVYSPAFTWKSLQSVFTGRQVIWLDVDKRSWLPIIPQTPLKDALIVSNHTFGNISGILRGSNEPLIYDGAQAFGAEIEDFGDATVFGFAPTKPVTCGEGGMIVTNNSKIAGLLEEKRHVLLRMSEFSAAVGLTYLNKLSEVQEERRKIWQYYNKNLPFEHQEVPFSHSLSVYGILVPEREKLIEKIKDKMEYRVYYEPLERGLKNTEWLFDKILCIPSYAGCPYKQIVEILT